MRIVLAMAMLAFVAVQAFAQNNAPPSPPVYPMPPPPPVVMTTPGGDDVPVRIDATDRATRCLQYGKSIGVPVDQIDDYTRRCALQ